MARKQKGYARAVEYDLDEALDDLGKKRPRRLENKLVMVPSLVFMGRTQPEDVTDEGISYRIPDEFVEWVFPDDAPRNFYPFVYNPVHGFTCGDVADVRYLGFESLVQSGKEMFYDEAGFDEPGSRPATRAAFKAIYDKFGGRRPLVVRLEDDDAFAEVTYWFLQESIGSSERFLWSYAANFRKLCLPLLNDALAVEADHRPVARCLAGGRGRLLNMLSQRDEEAMKAVATAVSRPGYLAMLYAMKAASEDQRNDVLGQMMDPERIKRMTVGDRLVDGTWIGSGKSEAQPYADAPDEITGLIATGLLSADIEQETLAISNFGEHLLSILPATCDDPDWKLSLFQPDGFIPKTRQFDADEWIIRYFAAIWEECPPAA